MRRIKIRLGEILLAKGLITEKQLDAAIQEQSKTKEYLGALLIKRRVIKEETLLYALAEQFDISVLTLKDRYIDWTIARDYSPSLILDNKCMPIEKENEKVIFAITNPLDAWGLNKAEEESKGMIVDFVLVSSGDMEEAIRRYKDYMRGYLSKKFE